MNQNTQQTPNRQAAISGLAIVGFIALIAAGMWLAVYSARFVPGAVSRLGAAAVSLSSFFNPAESPVSLATTTIPFGNGSAVATSTSPATTTTSTPGSSTGTGTPIAGTGSAGSFPIGTGPAMTPVPTGPADFVVTITTVGHLTTASTDSFVGGTTVPSGKRPAVKFTIKNIGGAYTGTWRFSASIPTKTAYVFKSPVQQSLGAGESIDYVLGFDQASRGTDKIITVTADPDNTVVESNSGNNSASAKITVQ